MKRYFLILLIIFIWACTSELPNDPYFNYDLVRLSRLMTNLNSESRKVMSGVYEVIEGKDLIGEKLAGEWKGNLFCMYSSHDVIFTELTGGVIKDSLLLVGNIRVVRSGKSIGLYLESHPEDGSSDIINAIKSDRIIFTGFTDEGDEIVIQRTGDNDTSSFYTLGHRAGCRNSERMGISENSIEMMEYAQYMGANGIELDVKQTRDKELIVFHDDTFSPRTVQGAYLLGKVSNYDLKHIKKFGRLVNGELIPLLTEALTAVIDNTEMSLIWLDIKSPHIVDKAIQIQLDAIEYAKSKNRDILILIGIPDKDIFNKYKQNEMSEKSPSLIELDADYVLNTPSCRVWAPRWTNGINNSDIDRVHNAGKLVFTWTLDVDSYIDRFLKSGKYEGFLTDYPSLVRGKFLLK